MKKIFSIVFSLLMVVQASAADIKMMSYNIKGHGMTDARVADIVTVINNANPDVVAVQEVDNRTVLLQRHNYLKDIADGTSMHYSFHALVGTYYGIGLLSKEEPIAVTTHTFTRGTNSSDKENRGIIIAEFPKYIFISTHYSLNADDRDTATAWIIDYARQQTKAVFVAGDFNAQPTYRAMVTFKNNGFKIINDTDIYTYPADDPTSCIDMVICYNRYVDAMKFTCIESGIAEVASLTLSDVSDHLPVYVVIRPEDSSVESVSADNISITRNGDHLEISGLVTDANAMVFSATGSLVKTANSQSLNIEGLPHGVYFVSLSNDTINKTIKVII